MRGYLCAKGRIRFASRERGLARVQRRKRVERSERKPVERRGEEDA